MALTLELASSPFTPITPELIDELAEAETVLETVARIDSPQAEPVRLRLKEDYILVYPAAQQQNTPVAAIRLSLTLHLQKILAPAEATLAGSERSGLLGFRLGSEEGAGASFLIAFAELARIWVRVLGRRIGQRGFHGAFKPIRKLGSGASAAVYEVLRLEDGARLAAKLFSKQHLRADPRKYDSFRNQLAVLRAADHPHLLALEGLYETDHSYYLVVEAHRGGNLLEYLQTRRVRLSLEQIRSLTRGVVEALAELERLDVLHRDVKLENLLLRDRQEEPHVVLADFGLAVFAQQDDLGPRRCGTPGYLSPEMLQAHDQHQITHKSDVFSAGVVLHVLLTARYLFPGQDPREVFEKNKEMKFDLSKPEYERLDANAVDLLRRMLEVDPAERLAASECLEHPFLRQEKPEVSPASTNDEDYHF